MPAGAAGQLQLSASGTRTQAWPGEPAGAASRPTSSALAAPGALSPVRAQAAGADRIERELRAPEAAEGDRAGRQRRCRGALDPPAAAFPACAGSGLVPACGLATAGGAGAGQVPVPPQGPVAPGPGAAADGPGTGGAGHGGRD